MTRFLLLGLVVLGTWCLGGDSARADAPVVMYVFPAGGQRGQTVKFHVGGLFLNKSCALAMVGRGVEPAPSVTRTTSPWFEGPLLSLPDSQRQEDYPQAMLGSVKIAADAPPGNRQILLRTAQGVTSPLTFVVGDLPEVVEQEVSGEPIPVAIATPITINGRIFPRDDVDVWAVTLKRGQRLSGHVDAGRIGSPLEAQLEVRDPHGRRVAEGLGSNGRDPRVRHTAAEDGVYHVHITDARSDGGPAFVYRLTLTTGPVVDRVFPLGGRRGTTVNLTAVGSMRTTTVAVPIPKDAPSSFAARTSIAGEATRPFELDVDDVPEAIEAVGDNALPVPGVANGRIDAPGEIDRWKFTASRGESLQFELRAVRLGSPLLGVLSITDSAGTELARAEPVADKTSDPTLPFTAPADGPYFVTVQDRFKSRGGAAFAYRLRVTRPPSGFELSFATMAVTLPRGSATPIKITARRLGDFTGPIFLSLDGLPPGVTAPKDIVLAPGQSSIDVALKTDAMATVSSAIVRLRGTALIPLTPFSAMPFPVTKMATWADDQAIDQVRLAVAAATPFKIAGDYELKLIPRGTVYTRRYRIERNGFAGPIEIDLADRQARHLQGVTGPHMVVAADKSEFDYPISLPPWMETGRTCRVCVMGTATLRDADGSAHVVTYSSREQNDQIIAVVEPERLGLRLDRTSVRAEPGAAVEVSFSLSRGQGLKGDAKVEILVPPEGMQFSAEPVTVAASTAAGKLTLKVARATLGPFPEPLIVRATVIENGRPVIAEAKVEVVR